MDVLFFSDNPELRKKIAKRRFACHDFTELRRLLTTSRNQGLYYIDVDSLKSPLANCIASISKKNGSFIGIIDPKGIQKTVMPLIHQGVVDYISPKELSSKPSLVHLKKVIAYVKKYRADFQTPITGREANGPVSRGLIPVPHGWKDVKIGGKYAFSMMFIELDEREEMEKRYGIKNLSKALTVFKKYIEKNVLAFGGRIWMWSNFGGIVLFPMESGDNHAVLCGFKIFMYKYLHDAEESHFPNFISFRIAMHLGNIVYQEKSKGEVVSDSLNAVFHLGQKHAEPGFYYITEDIFKRSPAALKPYFKELGSYEDRLIYRMKMLIL